LERIRLISFSVHAVSGLPVRRFALSPYDEDLRLKRISLVCRQSMRLLPE
jgi:hypothetical protein